MNAPDGGLQGKWLALATVGSPQRYIFRSNKLRENAGASELVDQAIRWWDNHPGKIFAGGGRAAVIVASEPAAKAEITEWSFEWLKKAPGLRLAAVIEPIGDCLAKAYERAQSKLERQEESPPFGSEPGAWPVVRECPSTGLAASTWMDGSWLSAEAAAKRKAEAGAFERLGSDFGGELKGHYQFPREFENFGQKEGEPQMAVVHADGDGIGKLFDETVRNWSGSDSGLKERLGDLSKAVDALVKGAMRKLIAELYSAYGKLRDDRRLELLEAAEGPPYFPLRPLVAAGDDLTFVCHGKLGLPAAAHYIRLFDELANERLAPFRVQTTKRRFTARAGVAIVHQKFPFARAYKLAADCEHEAKRARTDWEKDHAGQHGWIDFQMLTEGAAGDLRFMRSSLYKDSQGRSLIRRPYALGLEPGNGQSWSSFHRLWLDFQSSGVARGRIKQLVEKAARGDLAMHQASEEWEAAQTPVRFNTERDADGRLLCWDPIEMLDFLVDPWPDDAEEDAHVAPQN
jgi:hypothetical protein